jgi:hypothetical protein
MARTGKAQASDADELARLKARNAELEATQVDSKIALDDLIGVMSMIPWSLNLSTQLAGQGNTKHFSKFGEIKKILYSDLINIMDVHANLLESGAFYILDPRVIKQHGLQELYSKLLTKEKIDSLLSMNSDRCVELYEAANENQKQTIILMLIDKVRDFPGTVNLNIVDKLSRASGIDISKKAKDEQEILAVTSGEA